MKKIIFSCLLLISLPVGAVVISVTKLSNLVIGTIVQGDPAKIIPSGTAENAVNASFRATGNVNTAYTIVLPATASLTRAGAANLTLTNFQSFPAAGPNGMLGATGRQNFYVGATLSALPTNQLAGNYTGTFTVNVLY